MHSLILGSVSINCRAHEELVDYRGDRLTSAVESVVRRNNLWCVVVVVEVTTMPFF